MLTSLFGSARNDRRHTHQRRSRIADLDQRRSPPTSIRHREYLPHRNEQYDSEEDSENQEEQADEMASGDAEEEDDEDVVSAGDESSEDYSDCTRPLLPIFSAAHLDTLPVFLLTRTIRDLVIARCETTLSWDQLRSPQVSQFVLKPIQQAIQSDHFNAATEYALMANCLQFGKEAGMDPGQSGTNQTRAMICELLAIRLLKEYTTRELIDALSYDFDPLQGQSEVIAHAADGSRRGTDASRRQPPRSARISCFEVAIRTQAKRFLAHPSVVRQLEAIWAGTIVFHSAADYLHRKSTQSSSSNYGTMTGLNSKLDSQQGPPIIPRRAVTLYNPREASLFKLSRLRVPRYRDILSTMSFAVLLVLFLAVLIERSLQISTLEVIFWFWAAGYMLDEILTFNEQGFGLYIASFWNVFDLGILFLLFLHLTLRLCGIVMTDIGQKAMANMAYDVLAFAAILLFPRLFSVLDHYRYFSQLLIAFRLMAIDLMGVFVLILISCSGFFVALSLSFGNKGIDSPSDVAYALLQMLMGFTPAAWDRWDRYNRMGQVVLTLFLFICHFLVVTILITVLTNSFMTIARNANDEHQFVFAVNTISNVKSDALFSYVAPTNILQWLLNPLRYCIPFRQFVRINRTIIKCTHFPILFTIFFYEKIILQASFVDSIDLVEDRGRSRQVYAPGLPRLMRDPSIATMRQDRALEAVFRQPLDATIRSVQQLRDRRKTSNVVSSWMRDIESDTMEPPGGTMRRGGRIERRRRTCQLPAAPGIRQDLSKKPTSRASDPEGFTSHSEFVSSKRPALAFSRRTTSSTQDLSRNVSIDKDDESMTNGANDGDDDLTSVAHSLPRRLFHENQTLPSTGVEFSSHQPPLCSTPIQLSTTVSDDGGPEMKFSHAPIPLSERPAMQQRPGRHVRNISSATMIFRPSAEDEEGHGSSMSRSAIPVGNTQSDRPESGSRSPRSKPTSSTTHRTPKRGVGNTSRMRPSFPDKDNTVFRSTPNLAALRDHRSQVQDERRHHTFDMDLASDIGDNKAIGGGYVGAIPASIAIQMAQAARNQRGEQTTEEGEMIGRLVMARMNTLEEGFREVVHEMRETRRQGGMLLTNLSSQSLPKLSTITAQERKLGKQSGQSTPRSPRRRKEAEFMLPPQTPQEEDESKENVDIHEDVKSDGDNE